MTRIIIRDQRNLEAELKRVKEQVRVGEAPHEKLSASLVEPTLPRSMTSPPINPNIQERLDTDENLQVLKLKARRSSLNATYAPLFRRLGLSPETIAEFEDAKLRREEDQEDLFATVRKQGLSLQDPVVGHLLQDLDTRYREAQTASLGSDGYKQLSEYERTASLREIVGGSAGSATVAGVPFAPAQAEMLVQLMAQSIPEYQKGEMANAANIDWEVVDAQAKEILSPEQFVAFRTLEAHGIQYMGSRELTQLNALITKAAAVEKSGARGTKPSGG